jgi:hypothetical protein
MYPLVVRSGRFDSFVIGSSTSRLLDPKILDGGFDAHFANLAMDAMLAWEQQTMMDYFRRRNGAPKVVIVGLDTVWCLPQADRIRVTSRGFPDWLYDDDPWNDYLYLLNTLTVENAVRQLRYNLGTHRERVRFDGFEIFVPPESKYDLARARQRIRPEITQRPTRRKPIPFRWIELSQEERRALSLPALKWLDEQLAVLPPTTRKVLAYMPMHVSVHPRPGTLEAAITSECKERIARIARERGAMFIDWNIPSPITREDSNYWDAGHYRLPVAQRIARDLASAVLTGRKSEDGSYQIVVR